MTSNRFRLLLPVLLSALTVVSAIGVSAQSSLPALGDDPRIAQAGLQISEFASGLDFPMGMTVLPDNSLLVATSVPDGGSYFQSTGRLVRLTDEDGDGRADGPGTIVADGLPGGLVALVRIDDLVLVTASRSGEEAIVILRRGEHWKDQLTEVGRLSFAFDDALHQSYGLTVRYTPAEDKSYDIVFNVGAHGNVDAGVPVKISGLVVGELQDASLYLMTIHDDGEAITAEEPVLLATGLRNASALHFVKATGDLLIGDNGMDTPGNDIVSLSADEINVIPIDELATRVFDFGFPDTYVDYASGEIIGTEGDLPAVDFRPIDGSESEGIASLSPLPANFPDDLKGGYVAGFHGQFDSYGDANEENPLVFFDLASGEKFDLIANENATVGHLDSLYATDDVLYVADICSTGSLVESAPCGVIYQIRADG